MLGITGSLVITQTRLPSYSANLIRSVVLPTELSAAAVIATFYVSESTENYDYVVKMLHISTITILVCNRAWEPLTLLKMPGTSPACGSSGHKLSGKIWPVRIIFCHDQNLHHRGSP